MPVEFDARGGGSGALSQGDGEGGGGRTPENVSQRPNAHCAAANSMKAWAAVSSMRSTSVKSIMRYFTRSSAGRVAPRLAAPPHFIHRSNLRAHGTEGGRALGGCGRGSDQREGAEAVPRCGGAERLGARDGARGCAQTWQGGPGD